MPRKLLERLAAEQRAVLGGEGEEPGLEGLQAFEEDDSELVFDDVGPEVSRLSCQRWVHFASCAMPCCVRAGVR